MEVCPRIAKKSSTASERFICRFYPFQACWGGSAATSGQGRACFPKRAGSSWMTRSKKDRFIESVAEAAGVLVLLGSIVTLHRQIVRLPFEDGGWMSSS